MFSSIVNLGSHGVFVLNSDYMLATILMGPIQVDQNPTKSVKNQIYVPDFP